MTRRTASRKPGSGNAAKIVRPRLPPVIQRVECLRQLRDAGRPRMVYLSGRAGVGKTTLALSWLRKTRAKAVWLTLDEGDNDPVALLGLLADAFMAAFPGVACDLPAVPAGTAFDLAAFARASCRRLLSRCPGRVVIVLDDFHNLVEAGPGQAVVAALAEVLTPPAQLMVLSRRRPPAAFAKWIVAREVLHLAGDAFRFSPAEITLLYECVLRLPITDEEARSLYDLTEGWVAGLILLADEIRTRPPGPTRVSVDTGPGLGEYLCREIWDRHDRSIQDVMVATALLNAFSLDSAEALVRRSRRDVKSSLRWLVDHHLLFEVPTPHGVHYRYDALLRGFLLAQVTGLPDVERRALIERVAGVYETQGRREETVDLYLVHGVYDQAIPLIERVGLVSMWEGKRMRVRQWIRSLPPRMVSARPWLLFLLASDQALIDAEAAATSYRQALDGFERTQDAEGQISVLSSRIFLGFYSGRDYRPLEADAEKGRRLLQRPGRPCSPMARASFSLAEAIAAIVSAGQPERGFHKAQEAADLASREGFLSLAVWATAHAGYCAFFCGRFTESALLFERAEAIMPWQTLDPVRRAELLRYRGALESFRGEADKSLASLAEAEHLCLEYGLTALLPMVQANLVRQRVLWGEAVGAAAGLEPVRRRIAKAGNRYLASYLAYWEAIDSLGRGERVRALSQARQALRLLDACHSPLLVSIPLVLVGVILREYGLFDEAERALRTALRRFERAQSRFFAFWALMHRAKLSLDRGHEPAAKSWIAKALALGKTEGYVAGDGFTPAMMSDLLNRAREWGIEREYVETLMRAWSVAPAFPLTIRTLGRFEVALNGRVILGDTWRGRKTRDLLLALVTLGGARVSKESLMDVLWPDADGDRAAGSLHTTLHRLQTVLGRPSAGNGFIHHKGGVLSFDAERCWVDSMAFEEAVRRARQAESRAHWSEVRRSLDEVRNLYGGEYLPAFRQEAWIDAKRQALRREFDWVQQRLK